MRSIIYETVLAYCESYRPGGSWRDAIFDADCRVAPIWRNSLVSRLAEDFLEADLLASGVVTKTPSGFVLASALADEPEAIVGLRESPDARPYAILTSAGLLSREHLPVVAARCDYRVQSLAREQGLRIYLAFSMCDMMTLRGLGFPAALAVGLSSVNAEVLKQVLSAWEPTAAHDASAAANLSTDAAEKTASEASRRATSDCIAHGNDSERPPVADADDQANRPSHETETGLDRELVDGAADSVELILVAWSVARLDQELPQEYTAVAARLLDLGRYLGVDIANVAAWRPTSDELSRIRFCLDAGGVAAAADALQTSACGSVFALNVAPGQRGRVIVGAADYGQMISELEALARADKENFDPIALQEAYLRLERVIECDLVGPLLERAMATDDPLVRNLTAASASLARWLHRHAPFIGTKLARTADSGAPRGANGPHSEIAMCLRVAAEFRSIYRELTR